MIKLFVIVGLAILILISKEIVSQQLGNGGNGGNGGHGKNNAEKNGFEIRNGIVSKLKLLGNGGNGGHGKNNAEKNGFEIRNGIVSKLKLFFLKLLSYNLFKDWLKC